MNQADKELLDEIFSVVRLPEVYYVRDDTKEEQIQSSSDLGQEILKVEHADVQSDKSATVQENHENGSVLQNGQKPQKIDVVQDSEPQLVDGYQNSDDIIPPEPDFNSAQQTVTDYDFPYPLEHIPAIEYENLSISKIMKRQLETAELVDRSTFDYYAPRHRRIGLADDIEKIVVGGQQPPSPKDRTVILFGPELSGKSAVINTLVNYLYEVDAEEQIRFCINTPHINDYDNILSVYTFNNTKYPYRVTFVDTPGVPDEMGYTRTTDLIKKWFKLELEINGTLRIDALSLVVKHDEGELQWPIIDELTILKQLMRDDLQTNVMPMTTFGNDVSQPRVLRSIAAANIPFIYYYKINNAGYMKKANRTQQASHSHYNTVVELDRYFCDLFELENPLLHVCDRQSMKELIHVLH